MQLTILDIQPARVTPVCPEPERDEVLCKAFMTALLLTRNAPRAEAAVASAVKAWNYSEPFEEAILSGTIRAAISASRKAVPRRVDDFRSALSMLPRELRGVLCLSQQLRRCFVLRTLMGMPAEGCALLLSLSATQVERYATTAAIALGDCSSALESGCGAYARMIKPNLC